MQLTGNTVLITGGGTGIGRGLAEALHRLGNKVIIAGRREEPLITTASVNRGIEYQVLDQEDSHSVRRVASRLTRRHRDLNVLINNAGVMPVEDLKAGDCEPAEHAVAVNLLGVIRLTAALMPTLLNQQRAAVINVTSTLAFVPKAAVPTYSATKAALHSYTESLRLQLHPSRVEVVELVPPRVDTEIQAALGDSTAAMPLHDFITEAISLLGDQPAEVVVDRARPMRFATRDGVYEQLRTAVNPEFLQQ